MEKSKKKFLVLCAIFLASVILAACGGGAEETTPEPAEEETAETPETPETSNEEGITADEEESSESNEETTETLVNQGRELVQENCISCHGGNLEGAAGPNLNGVSERYSKEEVVNILINGQGGMPGGVVKGEEEAVAAYLFTLEE